MANFSSLFGKGTPANQPAFLLPLKGVIMFLSLVVLGISAYNLSLFNGYVILASTGPAGFMIFVVRHLLQHFIHSREKEEKRDERQLTED
jgi:hypothetical protein